MSINRVLIVGLGSIGRRHLRLARELLPNADIRVLRHQADSPVPDTANGGVSRIEEAVSFAPQIAVIASPATTHIITAQALAEAGVHLFIEKPLSASLAGVEQLVETCRQQGSVLLTAYNLRFMPSLQRYRHLLIEGAIGKVLSVRCETGQYLPSWRPNADYRLGVSAQRELGGGVLLELSHEIDYLRWIFGEVVWVKATLSRQSGLDVDVEDTAHLTLGFAPSVGGHQLIGSLNLDFIRHDSTRLCTAIGEYGSLCWNGLTGEVVLYKSCEKEWRVLFSHPHQSEDSYMAEWQDFLDCIAQDKRPMITGEDGLIVLQIIEAARTSATLGGRVSFVTKTPVTEAKL